MLVVLKLAIGAAISIAVLGAMTWLMIRLRFIELRDPFPICQCGRRATWMLHWHAAERAVSCEFCDQHAERIAKTVCNASGFDGYFYKMPIALDGKTDSPPAPPRLAMAVKSKRAERRIVAAIDPTIARGAILNKLKQRFERLTKTEMYLLGLATMASLAALFAMGVVMVVAVVLLVK